MDLESENKVKLINEYKYLSDPINRLISIYY